MATAERQHPQAAPAADWDARTFLNCGDEHSDALDGFDLTRGPRFAGPCPGAVRRHRREASQRRGAALPSGRASPHGVPALCVAAHCTAGRALFDLRNRCGRLAGVLSAGGISGRARSRVVAQNDSQEHDATPQKLPKAQRLRKNDPGAAGRHHGLQQQRYRGREGR
jgi:hypothetical protein